MEVCAVPGKKGWSLPLGQIDTKKDFEGNELVGTLGGYE